MGSILGILGGGGSKKKKYILKNYSSCRINMSQREREKEEKNVPLRNFFWEKADMKALRDAKDRLAKPSF